MKFPKHTASQSLVQPAAFYQGSVENKSSGNIEMMVDVKCALKCGGATALKCIPCGFNIPCWLFCAGPDAAGCIEKCF